MNYIWTSDCHLDHVDDRSVVEFAKDLVRNDPAGVFITGDISESMKLIYHLSALEKVVNRPIYFVLGNHDFWFGDIANVRQRIIKICNQSQYLKYMSSVSYLTLEPGLAVVGHDSWYDARNGDPFNSKFIMNDWIYTRDFVAASGGSRYISAVRDVADRQSLLSICERLARDGARHVRDGIAAAVKKHKKIIVLMHTPPFEESHKYRGKVGDALSQPWYTSKTMGEVLLNASTAFPNVQFEVLCGHTHGEYDGYIRPNLRVRVAGALYGAPSIAGEVKSV